MTKLTNQLADPPSYYSIIVVFDLQLWNEYFRKPFVEIHLKTIYIIYKKSMFPCFEQILYITKRYPRLRPH